MKKVQIVLLLGGGILFVMLVRRTGVDAIAGQVAQTGWTFLWVLGCDLLLETLHTIGWRHCFLPEERKIPWFDFFLCRKAGVAINVLTPTATMGGEAVKAMLVRRWVSFREGIASVVVDKLAFAIGQAVFLAAGLVPLFALVLESPRQRLVASLFMALWVSGLVAFWWLQRRGLFGRGLRAFRKLLRVAADNGLPERAEALDERIVCFLRERPGELVVSAGIHALAQCLRVAQFWLILRAFGFDPGLLEGFAMATGFVFIEATLFVVPARLGVFEGGNLLVFTTLGYAASTGLAVAFVLRISEMTSLLLGLYAFARARSYAATRPGENSPNTGDPAHAEWQDRRAGRL